MRNLLAIFVTLSLEACVTVQQGDLDAWVGQPISALESHPIFLTIPVIKSRTSDGTEIWNYANGGRAMNCSGSDCFMRDAACNNVFYIRDGRVLRYTPVGTGGVRCYTTEQLRPGFNAPVNIR